MLCSRAMHKQPDYSTWPTKDETAATLNISTKQVERYAQAGKLQQVRWKRPSGGQPIAVYAPADVERLAHTLLPSKPYVASPEPAPSNGHGLRRQAASAPTHADAGRNGHGAAPGRAAGGAEGVSDAGRSRPSAG